MPARQQPVGPPPPERWAVDLAGLDRRDGVDLLVDDVVDKHSTRARTKVLEARDLLDEMDDDVYPED